MKAFRSGEKGEREAPCTRRERGGGGDPLYPGPPPLSHIRGARPTARKPFSPTPAESHSAFTLSLLSWESGGGGREKSAPRPTPPHFLPHIRSEGSRVQGRTEAEARRSAARPPPHLRPVRPKERGPADDWVHSQAHLEGLPPRHCLSSPSENFKVNWSKLKVWPIP